MGPQTPLNFHKKIDLWIDQLPLSIPLNHTVPRTPKCWQTKGQRLAPHNVQFNPKFKAPKVNFLGGFSGKGKKAKLIFFVEYKRMNTPTVLSMWRRWIFPGLKRHLPNRRNFLIQQDGCKILNSALVRSELHKLGVHIAWQDGNGPGNGIAPPRSPDFWPMETVWAIQKKKLVKEIRSSTKWKKGVGLSANAGKMRAWAKFSGNIIRRVSSKTLQKLHDGMPARLIELRKAKGGPLSK